MNLQQIDYAIAVSELQSFSKAAEKCHITQSTLSTMVGRLEEEMGIRMFDRKRKPVGITREGEAVIRQLKIIAKEMENLDEVVSALKGEMSGTVSIGIIPTVSPYLLPLFLNEFTSRFPDLHFVVSEMTTPAIVEQLSNRSLDIGIVSTPLEVPDLVETTLYHEPFLLYDKTGQQSPGSCTPLDIDMDRLWLLEEGHCLRTQVQSICGMQEDKPSHRNLDYKSGTIDTLLKFVNRNNGVTLLPWLASQELSEAEQTHLHPFQNPVPARTVGLLVHTHFVKRRLLEELEQCIKEKIAPYLEEIEGEQLIIAPVV